MLFFLKQIEPHCAKALCDLFPVDRSIDIVPIAIKARDSEKRFSRRPSSYSSVPVKHRITNTDLRHLIPRKKLRPISKQPSHGSDMTQSNIHLPDNSISVTHN